MDDTVSQSKIRSTPFILTSFAIFPFIGLLLSSIGLLWGITQRDRSNAKKLIIFSSVMLAYNIMLGVMFHNMPSLNGVVATNVRNKAIAEFSRQKNCPVTRIASFRFNNITQNFGGSIDWGGVMYACDKVWEIRAECTSEAADTCFVFVTETLHNSQ